MDSVLTILLDEHKCCKSTLFLRPKNKHDELWDGARTGPEAALELFGVEEAYDIKDFSKIMQSYENLKPLVWFDEKTAELPSITNEIHKLSLPVNSVTEFVHSMRLFKSPAEQQLMRKTCQIASEAINSVMRNAKAGQSEHHLFAMVDYKCRMLNASHLAYPPVVAAGNNATTIHYINNTQLIKEGDLILMDAGCEYGGYTSDITRTWPITGSFTEPQKILYDIVYQVQSDLLGKFFKYILIRIRGKFNIKF